MQTVEFLTVLLLSLVTVPTAQQKPNLTGTWVVVSPAEAAGQEYRLTHDETRFIQAHDSEGDGHSFTYPLDGKEHRIIMSSHGADLVTLATASWNGERIVIREKTTYPDGRVMESTQAWSLDASGQLTVTFLQAVDGKQIETKQTAKPKK